MLAFFGSQENGPRVESVLNGPCLLRGNLILQNFLFPVDALPTPPEAVFLCFRPCKIDYQRPFPPLKHPRIYFPGDGGRKANTLWDYIFDFGVTNINLVPYLSLSIDFKQWFTIWEYSCLLWSSVRTDGPSSWKLTWVTVFMQPALLPSHTTLITPRSDHWHTLSNISTIDIYYTATVQ